MKDKVIVITGGSKGLGKEMARIFALERNSVVICSRSKDEVVRIAKEIGAVPFVANVSNQQDVTSLANFTVSTFGRIDIWVNNAGLWPTQTKVEEMDIEKLHQVFEVNVFGTMYGSKDALIQMHKQGQGTLLNIISSSALRGKPGLSGYAASKWAVRGFTDSIREEYRDTQIKILAVYPGGIKTNLFEVDKSVDTSEYMTVESVAEKIIGNLDEDHPLEELTIKRPA